MEIVRRKKELRRRHRGADEAGGAAAPSRARTRASAAPRADAGGRYL